MTREDWLNALTAALRPMFADAGSPLPEKVRVTCGWPSQNALSRKQRIGECWSPSCSEDKATEIFVSPALSDGLKVAGVVAHELVHAAVGTACGHKGAFIVLAKKIGLTKPWTSTGESDELIARLRALLPGAYPHGALVGMAKDKKQSTRLIKCECAECGYVVRTTRKWIATAGAPLCPCNQEAMEHDPIDEEDENEEGE